MDRNEKKKGFSGLLDLTSEVTHCDEPNANVVPPERQQTNPSRDKPKATSNSQASHKRTSAGSIIGHILKKWPWYVVFAFLIWLWNTDESSTAPQVQKPYQANPAPVRPEYVRPNAAPNGSPWPASAGYVTGYSRLHADGLSTVTVDNSQNDSDVFVKLVSVGGTKAYPVRQIFIPAYSRFTLKKVSAGNYDLRYRDLSTGSLSRSESFELEETPMQEGTQYSNMTMTLYKVQNGNMQTYGLSETEF